MSKAMMSSDVIQSEKFLKLPDSAQILYANLLLDADSYGILPNVSRSIRAAAKTEADLTSLIESGFVLPLPGGRFHAIAHWWVNNPPNHRNHEATYCDVIAGSLCMIGNSKVYELQETANGMAEPTGKARLGCIPAWSKADTDPNEPADEEAAE